MKERFSKIRRRRAFYTLLAGAFLLFAAGNTWMIFRAAHKGDAEVPAAMGTTPEDGLLAAAQSGDYVRVGYYLGQGAAVDACDASGRSALALAAAAPTEQAADTVNVLLAAGADFERFDALRQRPLAAAAATGNVAVLRLLLQYGASLDGGDVDGRTALLAAAEHGKTAAAEYLLRCGSATWPGRAAGNGPLVRALRGGHVECAWALLDGGVDPGETDEKGNTVLMLALAADSDRLVQRLLESGKMDIRHRNNAGENVLDWAHRKNHKKWIERLEKML